MKRLRVYFLLIFLLLSGNFAFSQTCISLSSDPGTDAQSICYGNPVVKITYLLDASVTGATISGLPAGVTGSFVPLLFTIEGTPVEAGSFNYTITTSGCTGTVGTATGRITVNSLPTATAVNNGPVCPGTPLTLSGSGSPGKMIAFAWSGPDNFSSALDNPTVSLSATASMAGIYYFTVTNSNGCQNTTTTTVIVWDLPQVSASNNGPVCVGTALSLTGLPAGLAAYSWSGPNGFTSPDRSPLVTSSATLANAGTYTLTVTDINGCKNTATTTVTVNPLPAALASNNGPVCIGTPLTLTGGPSGGLYSWVGPNGFTSSSQNPIVSLEATAAMAGIYTLTVTDAINGCRNSATTTVTINPLPVATAVNSGPVCEGGTINLTGGPSGMISYSWTGPNGFTSTDQNPVITNSTATTAGIYTLTVTNANSCSGKATTNVVINPLPVPLASNNGPVCIGSPLALSGGPSLMNSYSWIGPNGFTSQVQSPTVNSFATAAMAGVYTLTVVNSYGCQNSANTTVIVNAATVPVAANNGPVCSGAPLLLTGGPSNMTAYFWSGPDGFVSTLPSPVVSQNATVSMAGPYTLTIVNLFGCQSSTTTTAIVNQSPAATASNNGPVCEGTQLSLTGGPAGMTSYSWTGPNLFVSNEQNPVVNTISTLAMSGVYALTVTGLTGCQDTATTRANVFAVPVSNAGLGGVECDLDFILGAVPGIGTGLWSVVTGPGTAVFTPDAGNPAAIVTVSAFGSYTFRWTETNGPCSSSSVVTVNFYQPPIANPGTGGDECDLDFVLNAVSSSGLGSWVMTNGTGMATFNPNANSPGATVTVSEFGTKEFTWIEVNGTCSDSASVIVNFYQAPVANAGSGGNNCGLNFNLSAAPSLGLGTWTMIGGEGNAVFIPDANTPNSRVSVTAYGTHVFRWTETNGICSSSQDVSVDFIQQPAANGGNNGDECDLNFVTNAVPGAGVGTWSKFSGPGNVTFSPDAHQPDATVTVTQYGVYDLAWTEANSVCSSTDLIRVTFHSPPAVNAGADDVICKGRIHQLNATGSGTFQWTPANLLNNPNIPNPQAIPQSTTLFTVTLSDAWGCKNTDQVNIEVRVQPVANAGPVQELGYLFETTLEATAPGTFQTGEWTLLSGKGNISDKNNPAAHVSDLAVGVNSFVWTVSNGVCPASTDTVKIIVHDLKIPTLITPNLDGNNDYFVINGLETFGKTEVTVFNRWGAKVYTNEVYDNSWDGTDENSNPLPDDTYFYILKSENGRVIRGYVVIRR